MNIRRAEPDDLRSLAALFDKYRVWYRKVSDVEGAEKFLGERITRGESVIFVAEENGELVGFTQLYPLFSSVRMKRCWLLNDLFVLEEQRGKGISKKLLDAAKDLAIETGSAYVMLETEKTNQVGNSLYPSQDFMLYDANNFYCWENIP